MGAPEPVRPMDWQRAVVRDTRLSGSPVVAVAACLVTIAPGTPKRKDSAGRELPREQAWDFFASVPSLIRLSRLSDRSVRGALTDLRAFGYLFQVKRGGNRNTDRPEASTWRLTKPNETAQDADSHDSEAARNAGSHDGEAAQDAGWRPPYLSSREDLEDGANRHELADEPAPDASPRADVLQERDPMASTEVTHHGAPSISDADAGSEVAAIVAAVGATPDKPAMTQAAVMHELQRRIEAERLEGVVR